MELFDSKGQPVSAAKTNGVSRRELLGGMGLVASAAAVAGTGLFTPSVVRAQGAKVRVGIGLNYGPFNQPWRRGCWKIAQTVVEGGGEIVAVRGEPSKQSEQDAALALLDRDINVLVLGIYSLESETAFIVDEARKRNIKTVGFCVTAKDSPAVLEDTWATGMTMGYFIQNALGRQGTIAQTAESRGFYTPFDMESDMLTMMTSFEPRMKMLPFISGSTSTDDQISKGRENMLALLQANPEPGSLNAFVSWWWPLTIGAGQALVQMGRNDVKLFNHYTSDQLLGEMASGNLPIEFSTDVPYHTIGEKVGQLALSLGRGENVPNHSNFAPVQTILPGDAGKVREEIKAMDDAAIAYLKDYGG